MLKAEWTKQAIHGIDQIADYISLDSESSALKWIETIFSKEQVIIGNYRLIYRISVRKVEFITVKNSRE